MPSCARPRTPRSCPARTRWCGAAPLRERRWELLALAQYRAGAQGEALRTIRQLRRGAGPRARHRPGPGGGRPRAVDPAAGSLARRPRRPGRVTDRCPWQGLMAYDVGDAEPFFGRDADVAACLAILARSSFLALVGPSGSRQVLDRARRRAGRACADGASGSSLITPGRHPLQALSALPGERAARHRAGRRPGRGGLRPVRGPGGAPAFLERLADEARRRPRAGDLRADRLATQVTEHAGFSRLVEQGLHLVGALDEAGLRAGRRAARRTRPGWSSSRAWWTSSSGRSRDDPGALPLLSHALVETWQRREGDTLTVDGYRATGGIRGAVAQSAEQLYGADRARPAPPAARPDAPAGLPGLGGEAVRTQVPRRLIATDPHHEQLIELLVGARLVTSDEGVVEITHEALARAWPRLRGWLDDDVEGQRIRHHLSARPTPGTRSDAPTASSTAGSG